MKILLLLAILCAISYASISPKWTDINLGHTQNFNWTNVTAQSAPVRGEWNTINYCGVANAFLNYTYYSYEVGVNYDPERQHKTVYKAGSVVLQGDKASFAGVPDCEFFTYQVPQIKESEFYVIFNLYAFDKSDTYYDSYQSSIKIDFDI